MAHPYSFFVIFLSVLAPLAWWSSHVETSSASVEAHLADRGLVELKGMQVTGEHPADDLQRGELIEVLDRLVAYEHYYHSVYGHFTKLISRLGYPIPAGLADFYEIRVTEASRERLSISAFSEINGRTLDTASIDQDYEVHASFAIPAPRPEYLKSLALKQMRALRAAPAGQVIEEQGVFHGYFKYEQLHDSQDRRVVVALGTRPPVLDVRLEVGAAEDVADEAATSGTILGQKPANSVSTLEEAYLAQRIFHAEVGRYAKNWSELSKIASFRFEDKAQFGEEGQVPFGDAVLEIDAAGPSKEGSQAAAQSVRQENDRVHAMHQSVRVPSSAPAPLEIEAIGPEDGGSSL